MDTRSNTKRRHEANEDTEDEKEDNIETEEEPHEIVIDLGATSHMTERQEMLFNKDFCNRQVMVVNGERVHVGVKGMWELKAA